MDLPTEQLASPNLKITGPEPKNRLEDFFTPAKIA